MIRRIGLFIFLAASIRARAAEMSGEMGEAGWTDDSRYFVYDRVHPAGLEEWIVLDGRDGSSKMVGVNGFDGNENWMGMDEEQFEKWRAAHRKREGRPSRVSPDGRAHAEVVISMKKGGGDWENARWTRAADLVAELRVVRDGVTKPSVRYHGSAVRVRPYWSPDGRRLAWYLDLGPTGNLTWGGDYFDVVLGPAGGPNIQVLAHPRILTKVKRLATDAVERAGFVTTFVGKAEDERPKTVVYCAEGYRKEAEKIAAAMPGGAVIEKLSWKSPADLVVAVGASVLPAKTR